jgi:hypothetical protein
MAERSKTRRFASRAEAILAQDPARERPTGLADLIGEGEGSDLTDSRQAGKPVEPEQSAEAPRVRLEVRIPEELSEALREYVYTHRTSKAQAVTEALRQFLEGQGRDSASR